MAPASVRSPTRPADSRVRAVLGPTNTGKTHLAIERLCAHSSGAIGFPLRLLAREVYDRVCAIKGPGEVALITGEERIEPRAARWLLCTAEAMPVHADLGFVALDEAQLAADRERGHIFTDRLLHARGRDETMILGSATIEPLVRQLLPGAEIIGRPRFSTLRHVGAHKLSRIPPRSAIVAFSTEQVYAVAELLRRLRGGAAVVMGALSPETRNRQVAMYQAGEVDYLVATDAIGMGLNLDIDHVAFAGLSKFDGIRQRRLTPAEIAQIAGRAGRHQRDGTFGTLAGTGGHDAAFTDEEIRAVEDHRFAPLTRLFWREAEPRFDNLTVLMADLERRPDWPGLAPAPEATDLAVLRHLAADPAVAGTIRGRSAVRRFWDACSLPDFRQAGVDSHARFVARLWQDLRGGQLDGDFVARAIAELDRPDGDLDTLQMRIAAIRSWAYIAQRPDWVIARDEMAARARAVEARLSDALHARLTERFVNRRTAVLMKRVGADAALLPVRIDGDDVLVDGEHIGQLHGFSFRVDPAARLADRKLLIAGAERHLPALLSERARQLADAIAAGTAALSLDGAQVRWGDHPVAGLMPTRAVLAPRLVADPSLGAIGAPLRDRVVAALGEWLDRTLAPLAPLRRLADAATDPAAGPELRAVLIALVEQGGAAPRAGLAIDRLNPGQRARLNRLGVRIGTLDVFLPALIKPAPLALWRALRAVHGTALPAPAPVMPPAIALPAGAPVPAGYRRAGRQAVRIDIAEKLLRLAHTARLAARGRDGFVADPELAVSSGLSIASHDALLRSAGFVARPGRPLCTGMFGPPAPVRWRWQPRRPRSAPAERPPAARGSAFAALAALVG